ncbi:hypothetical protein FPRO05_13729 [Fusarium proliferatum]|uniref:Uncharacterized protein n=1 Tax=Gibberella intermedia TaxID=948311 RepID=A0A365MXY2_GIBIN|nr:hypothetical protein FPRO05_13729 [Fusarium proliferatum]
MEGAHAMAVPSSHSGLEIAVSVLAVVETAISTTKTLHAAYKQKKDLPQVCSRLQDKLQIIRDIVKIVEGEKFLHTPNVITQLAKLRNRGHQVNRFLESIDPDCKGSGRLFFHQLLSGSDDKQKLKDIIGDLEWDRDSLMSTIQVVAVGLMKERDSIFVETDHVIRIDNILRKRFGEQEGLKIMKFIEYRKSDERVILTMEDIKSLEDEMVLASEKKEPTPTGNEPTSTGSHPTTRRTVLNNIAKFQSIQFNAPLTEC